MGEEVAVHWRCEPAGKYDLDILEASPIVALNDEKHAYQNLWLLDVPPRFVTLLPRRRPCESSMNTVVGWISTRRPSAPVPSCRGPMGSRGKQSGTSGP